MKKLLSLILEITLILSLGLTVSAANSTETVDISYRGITIVLDGAVLSPADAQGKATEPFILDGTTYLPVRAVADALGLNVTWNSETSTVTLSSDGEKSVPDGHPALSSSTKTVSITYRNIKLVLDGAGLTPTDANGNPVEPFIMDGSTYLPIRAVASALGLEVEWNAVTSTVTLTTPKLSTVTITTVRSCDRAGENPISTIVRTETYSGDRLICAETRDGSGELISTERCTYGGDGLLQFSIIDVLDGEVGDRYTRHFYRDGQLHSSKEYENSTRPKVHSYDTDYRFDEHGNLVWKYMHLSMGSWLEYTAEYDEAGRIISDFSEYYDIHTNNFSRCSTIYSYENGVLVRSESIGLVAEYFYGSDGRLAKTVAENLDGSFTIVTYAYSD